MEYPSLLARVQSAFIDGIITFILIGLLITATNSLNGENIPLKVIAIFLGLSYEPICTAFFRTAGQMIVKNKVVDFTTGKKINLLNAYLRFIIKTLLGWLSFTIMFSNKNKRAFHDFAAGSVVLCMD